MSDPRRKKGDSWSEKARREGYLARSVYKLEHILKLHPLLKKRASWFLDCGCAPGSWSQYMCKKLGGRGVGVDLKETDLKLPGYEAFVGDLTNEEVQQQLKELGPFKIVLSDAAPNTTGDRLVDTQRSLRLCRSIFSLLPSVLEPSGAFICKIFQGGDEEELFEEMKSIFEKTARIVPPAVRSSSFEIYFLGEEFKG